MNKKAVIVIIVLAVLGTIAAFIYYIANKNNRPKFTLGDIAKLVLEGIAKMFRPQEIPELPAPNVKYAIMNNAHLFRVPYWIAFTIAKIESDFNPNASGSTGDFGLFQITEPVLIDFNLMGLERSGLEQPLTLNDMYEPRLAAIVACWHIARLLKYFHNNIENAVKAYNTGFDLLPADKATAYWNRFQAERLYWEGLDYSKI